MRTDRISLGVFAVLSALVLPASASDLAERVRARSALRPQASSGVVGSAALSPPDLVTAMDVTTVVVTSARLAGDIRQASVFTGLGTIVPGNGPSFAWLSSGVAGAGSGQEVHPSGASGVQPGWQNVGGESCPRPPESGEVGAFGADYPYLSDFDCAALAFTFTAPAGASSFSFDFNFLSAEYPEFVGSMFNDGFLVKMESATHTFENIVFDAWGNPITIGSAFFNQSCTTLTATGFDIEDEIWGGCDAGGTGILTTQAPVEPGEDVTLTFHVYDAGDGLYDSAVMLDNFVFSDEVLPGPVTNGQVIVDHLSPKSGPLSGGTTVLVYGEGFVNVQSVKFGGVPAFYNVLDANTIEALTPAHAEGAVDVVVTAQPILSISTGVRPGGFIYYSSSPESPLAVLSVDPSEGPRQGGVPVSVRGAGFKPETVITFDGHAVPTQQYVSFDEIVVVTPAGTGNATVRASNPDGDQDELEGGYRYLGDGASGGGGCACALESPRATPGPGIGVFMVLAAALCVAWSRRRAGRESRLSASSGRLAAFVVVAAAASGCDNDPGLAPANSPPIADAGPSGEAFVGQAILLDGSQSRDFEDGSAITFDWKIVTEPEGSDAELDDESAVTPTLLADRPGLYRVGLVVTDTDGNESGEIGWGGTDDDNVAEFVVLPFRDLRVTLTWDEADSDLDLHLVRPHPAASGGYFDPDDDCFYGAPDPEWGTPGIESDNPLLSADVEAGGGPEEISLASPQDAGDYVILVHLFNDHGAGSTAASVSVSVDGVVVGEVATSAPLEVTDTVWRVGRLSWPEHVFVEDNSVTTHQALGGPPH